MGIRRRRRRLTTLMSRLDQRVRAVELRPISLLTSDQVNAAVELGEVTAGPETIVSASAPWQFRRIQDAYLYPKALTGTEDRVEIYLESDLGAVVGDRLEVSGIHGATDLDIDVTSDNFTVAYLDTPPWDGRQVGSGSNQITKHSPEDDQLTGVTITNTYSFKPETLAPQTLSSETRLQTRRKVDTYSITGTAVTLTMNANHKFQEGDVIFVDIFSEDSRAYGLDGLFYVTAVTDDTIEYTLDAGVDTPTGDVDVSTADIYVFPVAREWAQLNSIWIDSTTNQQYYWNGIRWAEYTPGSVEGDGDPPSAPTGFSVSMEMGFPNEGNIPVVQAALSWTAPTTSESGSELTDLAQYKIQYREGLTGEWITWPLIDDPTITSYTFGTVGTFRKSTSSTTVTYYFRLIAKDSGGEESAAATTNADSPEAPATNITTVKPVLSNDPPYLGTVTIYWNGTVTNVLGATQDNPEGIYFVELHRSTSSTFTASDSTLIGTVAAIPGAKFVDGSLSNSYGTTFYYVAVLVDGNGTRSIQSDPPLAVTAQSNVDVAAIQGIIEAANITPGTITASEEIIGWNITGQLIRGVEINAGLIEANSITSDQIDVGNLTAQTISSGLFTSRTVTSGVANGAGVTFDTNGIYAYNISNQPTFTVNAFTGQVWIGSGVTIGGYATTDSVNSVSNVATNASNTANSASTTANSASSLASNAANVAANAATIAGTANTNASNALSDISDLENVVIYPGTTYINGGNIKTGTIVANAIGAGTLAANVIYAGNVSATQVTAGTFTGSTFRTSSEPNKRIVVSSVSNTIKTFNSGDLDENPRGTIEGISTGFRITGYGTQAPTLVMGSNSISTYGGASTRPQLLLGATGALMYGYNSSGTTSDKTRLSLASTAASLYGPYLNHGIVFYNTYSIWNSADPRVNYLSGNSSSTVSATTTGSLYRGTGSDRRIKTDIQEISYGTAISIIDRINPVTYSYSHEFLVDGRTHYGVVAQDLQEALDNRDEIVIETRIAGETYLGVEYNELIPLLISSVKGLKALVENLQNEINQLKGN